MSKIISQLLEEFRYAQEVSALTTVFFVIIFGIIVYRALKLKKSEVEEYKRIPLDDDSNE